MHFDFLICSERSGSNLITKILDAHSEVCGPSPTHLTRTGGLNLYRYGDLLREENWKTLVSDSVNLVQNKIAVWESKVEEEELHKEVKDRRFSEIVRYIYEKEASAQGKKRLFVKENHTHSYISFLLSHFPEARFLWMVRDPRDMALTWKEAGTAQGGVKSGAKMWFHDQSESLKAYGFLRDTGRIMRIRFEDLLSKTESTVRGVCDFLDLRFEPGMLEFHQQSNTAVNSNRLTSWRDLQKPVLKNNFNLFRDRLSEAENRYVELLCAEEMDIFGYSREYERDIPAEEAAREERLALLASQLPPEPVERVFTEEEEKIYPPFFETVKRFGERKMWNTTE